MSDIQSQLASVRDEIKAVQSKGWWLAYEMTPLREQEAHLRMQIWRADNTPIEDDDNAEWEAQVDSMLSLYKSEVSYGLHVTESAKNAADAVA